MNKFSKILGGATVAVLATMNAKAVEVKHFEAQIYEAADMEEITKQDPFLTVAIKVFQDSYRAHLDELRAKENPSDLLRTDNYKYFLTINKVIIEEMVKMAFGIEVTGDSVNYVKSNKDKVIECISGGGNIYKSIELYDASNWNYLLLINVLNQVKHSEQQINAQLIKDTAELIAKQAQYSKYTIQLSNAVYDITEYFNELELYGYLEKTRAIKWDDSEFEKEKPSTVQVKTTKAQTIKTMRNLFAKIAIQVTSGTKKDGKDDEDKVDIFEVMKSSAAGTRVYEIDLRNHYIDTRIANGRFYDERDVAYLIMYGNPNSHQGKIFYEQAFLEYDLCVLYKLRTQLDSGKIPLTLLTQAQETGLSADEKTYLDMWNIKMFLLACGFNKENIMYDRENMFWVTLRKMLSDLEDQLLPIGTEIPGNKELSDLYVDKINEILKKIKK